MKLWLENESHSLEMFIETKRFHSTNMVSNYKTGKINK